jgi:hypothetical protein
MLDIDIQPNGMGRGDEVELWYQLINSLKTLLAKLDADGDVAGADYTAICYTALINGHFYNLAGSRVGVHVAEKNFYIVNPRGIDDKVRQQAMCDFTNAIETLCEKMDLDGGITLTTYEANGFTAKFLQGVENPATGAILGVKTGFVFRRGAIPKNEYITWLHNAVDALETITEQLDGDGGITATNFEALCFTATLLRKISKDYRSAVGN